MSNVILGFGSTEKNREATTNHHIYDVIKKIIGNDYESISDENRQVIEKTVREMSEESRKASDICDKETPRPERYGSFYATCTFGCSDVVVIVKWSHINSQHPLSPDGMAMMQTKDFIHISSFPD